MREPLSVLVPCGNSEQVIEECLKSVAWADELLIVDSFSNDETLTIARKYASRILQHEYINSATQKNWAIPQVVHNWLLIMDTDERVSTELRHEIEMVLENPARYTGFKIPRLNYAWGHPLRYGGNYPDYQLRLFRKDCGYYQLRQVHAHVQLTGQCGMLHNPFIHIGQRSTDQVIHHLLGQFTTWEAQARMNAGSRFTLWDALGRPIGAFLYRYLLLRGILDGIPGFLMAGTWAMYVFLTYAKMWEQENLQRASGRVAPPDLR